MVKMKKILAVFLLITVIAGMFTGCAAEKEKHFQTLKDFEKAKIGIATGSAHDLTAQKVFPNATRVYFNTMADMALAVEQGKVDGYLEDEPFLAPLLWEGLNMRRIDETVGQMNNGFVFPEGKNTELREKINEFLAVVREDGTVERLVQKWMGETEPTEHPDYKSLTGENGAIRLAISVDNKPMLYQSGTDFTGFEMELLTLFGQQYGYKFDIEVVPFESIIAGISADKYDMGASCLNITPEQIFDHPQKEKTRQFVRHLKVLEYPITSKDFDFIGLNTQIEEFGRKRRISQRSIYNIQAYVEEMCVQIILPQLNDPFEMLVTVEYSEEHDDADVLIRYTGEAFDPTQTENDLSLLLAKRATAEIVHRYDPEQKLGNTVSAQI